MELIYRGMTDVLQINKKYSNPNCRNPKLFYQFTVYYMSILTPYFVVEVMVLSYSRRSIYLILLASTTLIFFMQTSRMMITATNTCLPTSIFEVMPKIGLGTYLMHDPFDIIPKIYTDLESLEFDFSIGL